MSRDTRLCSNEGIPFSDHSPYKRLVGQLIYLLNTRPNIVYGVQQLNEHMRIQQHSTTQLLLVPYDT